MDILRLFFEGKRKYATFGVVVVAGYFIAAKIRSAPPTHEITLKKTTILRTVYGLGTVEAERVYHLKIGIAANIIRLYVREGDIVKKGARLVEFDQVPMMTAPFAGAVTKVAFKEGESVFPQNAVLTVTDLNRKYITVSLDEKAAVLISINQKVRIAFDGLPGKTFTGLVTSVYPSEGQFIVRVDSIDMPAEILPGMSADLSIEAGKIDNVFVVPIKSVQEGKINVSRNGKNLKIPVQLGLTQGDSVEIASGDVMEGDILRYKQ